MQWFAMLQGDAGISIFRRVNELVQYCLKVNAAFSMVMKVEKLDGNVIFDPCND